MYPRIYFFKSIIIWRGRECLDDTGWQQYLLSWPRDKKEDHWVIVTQPVSPSCAKMISHPLETGLFVSNIISILIIVSFALLYFFLSIYPFITLWFQGEINALPLNYSLGTKFRHLVVKIALLFVFSIIFPNCSLLCCFISSSVYILS